MEKKYERLLEAYFAGTLSQAEQEEMNALLASDSDFAAEFAWQKSVASAIRLGVQNDPLTIKLSDLERRFRFRKVIIQISAVAATVVLLISAIWFFNRTDFSENKNPIVAPQDTTQEQPPRPQAAAPQTPDTQNIATTQPPAGTNNPKPQIQNPLQKAVIANFQHFQNTSKYNNAGSVDEKDSLAVKAYRFYNDSAYHQAAQAFKALVQADADNMENRFYYGISLLGDKQFAAAAKTLQPVTEKQGKYQVPAKFFLGMAFTGAGQFKESRQAFQEYLDAPRNNQQFKDLAKNMLKKLPSE